MGRPAPTTLIHYDCYHLLFERGVHRLVDLYRFPCFKDAGSQSPKYGKHHMVLSLLHDDRGISICVPFHAVEPGNRHSLQDSKVHRAAEDCG